MPSYPSENLRRALKEAGVDYAGQDRISLRGLLEERVGEPPPESCSADDLAKMVLALSGLDPAQPSDPPAQSAQ